jgi:hypothetical protein
MMDRRLSLLTADEIRRASAHASFGSDPVATVLTGLVDIAAGFRSGHTVTSILVDLGLIGRKSRKALTKRGREVLYDLLIGVDLGAQIARPIPERTAVGVLR